MASSSASDIPQQFFGWDLLYNTVERSLNKNADIVIALVHHVLIRQYNLRCLGVGEDKTLSENENGSELLPSGWNDDDNKYALRYRSGDQLYILFANKSLDYMIINLLEPKTMKVANISLEPDQLVAKRTGNITDIIPRASEIANRLCKELVDPVFPGNTRETTTQTHTAHATSILADRSQATSIPRPLWHPIQDPFPGRGSFSPVGRNDLDPLGGAGNLLPFPSQSNFGRPRFDPFNGPGTNFDGSPNRDEFQPPGFGNNHNFYT